MGNLSLVFHLVSLIILLGFVMWVLRLQVMLKVWRDWAGPSAERKIIVGEPIRVLRQFACAIGADFESEVPVSSLPPARLSLDGCFDLHRCAFVEAVTVKGGARPVVCFVLSHGQDTIEADHHKLVRELGGSVAVEFIKSP